MSLSIGVTKPVVFHFGSWSITALIVFARCGFVRSSALRTDVMLSAETRLWFGTSCFPLHSCPPFFCSYAALRLILAIFFSKTSNRSNRLPNRDGTFVIIVSKIRLPAGENFSRFRRPIETEKKEEGDRDR